MQTLSLRRTFALAALALLEITALQTALAAPAHATDRRRGLVIIGLTADRRLVAFRSSAPSRAREIGPLAGLSGDTRLVGIDFRPATGALYGLGDAGGIYTLDTRTGQATFQAQLSAGGAPLIPAGSSFGVDFNPTVDRLRVVSDTGQNLRVDVDTGAASVDPSLNSPGPPPLTQLGVAGAGYTNNDADPNTGTTLYDVDALLDQLLIQAPPNAGSLNPVGKLGLDAAPEIGFDVYSFLKNGSTVGVAAFASLRTDRTRLYEVDLFTGKASLRGLFRTTDPVIGIAIPPNQL